MKKLITFFIASILGFTALATNFYTVQDGDFNNASIWRGSNRPGYNSVNKWSGAKDTVFIMHKVTVNASFSINGQSINVVVGDGAALSIAGNVAMNNSSLVISRNGKFELSNDFTTYNTSGSKIIIDGEMIIGRDANQIAGSWNIGTSGSLIVGRDFKNNTSSTNFQSEGKFIIGNNIDFHSGSFLFSSTSEFISEGSDVLVGHANIINDGYMTFPNATNVATWSGNWDCDGNLNGGTVAFGQDVDCNIACNAGGSGSCSNNVTLPVEWLEVSAENTEEGVLIRWATAQEKNNAHFEIEKSNDGVNWAYTGTVEGAGNSKEIIKYEFVDYSRSNNEVSYYRIKQVDFDGAFAYSNIVFVVNMEISKEINQGVYPNPNAGEFYYQLGNDEQILDLQVVSVEGEFKKAAYFQYGNLIKVTCDNAVNTGFYSVIILTDNNKYQIPFVVK